MLEVIRKHEEIMQERFEEKYWFWIIDRNEFEEEYIDNMKVNLIGNGRYVLDRYNGGLDVETFDTLEETYLTGIDYDYGKHIYESVLEELEAQ